MNFSSTYFCAFDCKNRHSNDKCCHGDAVLFRCRGETCWHSNGCDSSLSRGLRGEGRRRNGRRSGPKKGEVGGCGSWG